MNSKAKATADDQCYMLWNKLLLQPNQPSHLAAGTHDLWAHAPRLSLVIFGSWRLLKTQCSLLTLVHHALGDNLQVLEEDKEQGLGSQKNNDELHFSKRGKALYVQEEGLVGPWSGCRWTPTQRQVLDQESPSIHGSVKNWEGKKLVNFREKPQRYYPEVW